MSIALLRKLREPDIAAEQERIRLAQQAEFLMQDEAFQRAFDVVGSVYRAAWENSDMLDIEKRERCWQAVQLLSDIKNQLISAVRDGEAAQRRLEKAIR